MITELEQKAMDSVSGGDEMTRSWGQYYGGFVNEVREHPVAFLIGGPIGVYIAHKLES
jgi:hypothetical protein